MDVNAVGLGLRDEFGIKAGDCVALMTPNHVDFFACMHGPAKLGAMVTPINSSYREREIEVQLLNSKAKVAICHSDVIAHVREAAAAVSKQTGGRPISVLDIDADVGRLRQDGRRPGCKLLPKTPVTARDTVYLPYSSGTTGLPKGVMLTHSNLVSNLLQSDHIDCRHYAQSDVTISPLPLFHIYGFLASLHNPVINGNTLVTMKRFDFERFLQLVQEHKAARAHLVPPVLLALSKSPLVDKYNLKSLKMIISAAAPLGVEVEQAVTKRLDCKLKQFWGMSELSPLGTGPTDDHVKPGFVGPPVANTAVKVIDVASGKTLGPGLEGELCVKGPQVRRSLRDRCQLVQIAVVLADTSTN